MGQSTSSPPCPSAGICYCAYSPVESDRNPQRICAPLHNPFSLETYNLELKTSSRLVSAARYRIKFSFFFFRSRFQVPLQGETCPTASRQKSPAWPATFPRK